jgi:type III secretion system chaperone SycN
MDWVTDTISAFGRSMGLPDLEFDEDGYVLFDMEPDELLCVQDLQPAGSEFILVTLAKRLPEQRALAIRKALRAADFRGNPTWQMQVGSRDEDLVATLRVPRHSFVVSALEEAVETLFDFHKKIAGA